MIHLAVWSLKYHNYIYTGILLLKQYKCIHLINVETYFYGEVKINNDNNSWGPNIMVFYTCYNLSSSQFSASQQQFYCKF